MFSCSSGSLILPSALRRLHLPNGGGKSRGGVLHQFCTSHSCTIAAAVCALSVYRAQNALTQFAADSDGWRGEAATAVDRSIRLPLHPRILKIARIINTNENNFNIQPWAINPLKRAGTT